MIPHSYVRLLKGEKMMVIFCHALNGGCSWYLDILTRKKIRRFEELEAMVEAMVGMAMAPWMARWGVRKVVIYYYLEDLDVDSDVDCWLMLTDVDWCLLMLTDVDWCWLAAPWVWTASESLTSRSSSHCLFTIFRHIWLCWLAFGAKTARFNRFDQVKPFKTGGVISSPWAFSPGWYLPDSRAQAGQQWYATRSPFPVLAWLGMGNPLFMCNIYI